jgi:hypothetical protein
VTDPILQTQLLRLADGIAGFTVADAAAGLLGVPRETIAAALGDLVGRGKLRESNGAVQHRDGRLILQPAQKRYYRVRDEA